MTRKCWHITRKGYSNDSQIDPATILISIEWIFNLHLLQTCEARCARHQYLWRLESIELQLCSTNDIFCIHVNPRISYLPSNYISLMIYIWYFSSWLFAQRTNSTKLLRSYWTGMMCSYLIKQLLEFQFPNLSSQRIISPS